MRLGVHVARTALVILIVSVVLSALMGIIALLSGDFGEVEARILFSTLCVSGASILAMASGAALERRRGIPFALIGLFVSVLGFFAVIVGIWIEVNDDDFWRSSATAIIVGTWGAHAALLSLPRLVSRYLWTRIAAILAAGILAFLLIGMIWGDWVGDEPWRAVGIFAILATAGTILVPVFGRLSAPDLSYDDQRFTPSKLRCPHCGGDLPKSLLEVFE